MIKNIGRREREKKYRESGIRREEKVLLNVFAKDGILEEILDTAVIESPPLALFLIPDI